MYETTLALEGLWREASTDMDDLIRTVLDRGLTVVDFGFTAPQLVEKIGLSEDKAKRIIDLQGKPLLRQRSTVVAPFRP